MNQPHIAVLGLGAMGSRMADRLLAAGYPLSVYNRTQSRAANLVEKGARAAETPAAAVQAADIVVCCVTDDTASKAVWLGDSGDNDGGALAALKAGAIVIESSTLTANWMRELGGKVIATGRGFLDAPVAGSRPQAEAGILIHLVGGDPSTIDKVRPILDVMGKAVHRFGDIGSGTVAKLCVNELLAVQLATIAEVRGLAIKGGLEEQAFLTTLAELPVIAPIMKGLIGLIQQGDHAPRFTIDLIHKDLGYAASTAEEHGGSAPIARAAQTVYEQAQEAGLGDENMTAVSKVWD